MSNPSTSRANVFASDNAIGSHFVVRDEVAIIHLQNMKLFSLVSKLWPEVAIHKSSFRFRFTGGLKSKLVPKFSDHSVGEEKMKQVFKMI
jgi:hypothetical protein